MKTIVMRRFGWLTLGMVILFANSFAQQKRPTLREEAAAKGKVNRSRIIDYRGCCADLDDLVRKSEMIVRGRVVDSKPRLSPDEMELWTDYTIEILDVYKDVDNKTAKGSMLLVSKEGGETQLDGHPVRIDTPMFPALSVKASYIFFLSKCVAGPCPSQYMFMGNDGALSLDTDDAACKSKSHVLTPYCGFSANRFISTVQSKTH
jgi:hypothetical protein